MTLFHQEMLRVRTLRDLDARTVSDLPSVVEEGASEGKESVLLLPSETVTESVSLKKQTPSIPSDNELTPSEKMLFGDRQVEPAATVVTEAVPEEPPEGEKLTIS